MQASRDRRLRAAAWGIVPALALMCAAPAPAAQKRAKKPAPPAPAAPSETVLVPAVTIAPEVFTPEGKPRLYPVGGGKETIWQPGMPVYIGDRVSLRMFVATGAAPLREMRVRIDNEPVQTLTQAPWVLEVDTANWTPGYHFVEVFAQSSDANAPVGSGGAVLFVREAPTVVAQAPEERTETTTGATEETITEPVTAAPSGGDTAAGEPQPPAHPGAAVPTRNGVPLYPAGLDVTIHARSAAAERAIRANEVVRLTEPTLFQVSAGRDARRFIYALTRGGREIFRSEALPITAMVRLQPQTGTEGVGLLPGELMLWIWAGNAQGVYGAPAMVRVEVVSPR